MNRFTTVFWMWLYRLAKGRLSDGLVTSSLRQELEVAQSSLMSAQEELKSCHDWIARQNDAIDCLTSGDNQKVRWVRQFLIMAREIVAKNKEIGKLEEQATTDPLTGLFNRRGFEDGFSRELAILARDIPHPPQETGERRELPVVSLVIVDVDHFKRVNDTYGHPAGDAVLAQLAKLIQKHLGHRKSDLAARIGGEEFGVAMPHADMRVAGQQAESFLEAVRKTPFPVTDSTGKLIELQLTASCGVATIEIDEHSLASVVSHQLNNLADQALYQAKKLGRDRVVWGTIAK